ncbi:MAG: SCP2 sterol-binding domain-containing protein [Deltaproteobacteria bacterium]
MKGFRDAAEFRRVFEQIFQLMNETPEVGRKLRDAHAPHRFVITDLDLEFHVDGAPVSAEKEGKFLRWSWGKADWQPVITMRMSSEVANRFFQGKENVALALALGRVKLSGPPLTLLQLAPVTNPIHPVYRAWLKKSRLDHLLA